MASAKLAIGRFVNKTLWFNNSAKICLRNEVRFDASRSYARLTRFIDPVFKKDKQDVLYDSGEAQKTAHLPVKPARNEDTSSVFHDEVVRKFTNHVMRSGQKALARQLMEKTFENIKRIQLERLNKLETDEEKTKVEANPQTILQAAISNTRPALQLVPIKRGGVTYQVPVPITEKRSIFLSMKWIIIAAKEKERTVHFPEKLAWELLDAAGNQGRVVKRKQDLHKQCEANRAYAHYRWS